VFRRKRDDELLLVSGFGDTSGGGIFLVARGEVEQLDAMSSTGLAVGNGRVARLTRSATELYGSELLVYDEAGIERYVRLDGVVDPHDIVWDGSYYVVASTAANSVFWLSPSGDVVRRWAAPGHGDAWHLNSLLIDRGRLFAAAFGRFERHREWVSGDQAPTGFVFDVETGESVVSGLSSPHHPRPVGKSWLVCNSGTRELIEVDRDGATRRRLYLGKWTRGLAVTERLLYVGEIALRGSLADATASVAVVSRDDWTVVARIPLPCDEVYDIVVAPEALIEGVRRGFRTNPVRTAERDQLALFDELGVRPMRIWAIGDALPPEACRVALDASVPPELAADTWHELDCRVENLGTAFFVSAPPHPVHLSYRWVRDGASEEGARSRLPRTIAPRTRADCRVGLAAPSSPGTYELRLTLVQEGIAWFDDLDARNAWSARVRVV
jgi:acetolactate synthase-1/2/3 large subunit